MIVPGAGSCAFLATPFKLLCVDNMSPLLICPATLHLTFPINATGRPVASEFIKYAGFSLITPATDESLPIMDCVISFEPPKKTTVHT